MRFFPRLRPRILAHTHSSLSLAGALHGDTLSSGQLGHEHAEPPQVEVPPDSPHWVDLGMARRRRGPIVVPASRFEGPTLQRLRLIALIVATAPTVGLAGWLLLNPPGLFTDFIVRAVSVPVVAALLAYWVLTAISDAPYCARLAYDRGRRSYHAAAERGREVVCHLTPKVKGAQATGARAAAAATGSTTTGLRTLRAGLRSVVVSASCRSQQAATWWRNTGWPVLAHLARFLTRAAARALSLLQAQVRARSTARSQASPPSRDLRTPQLRLAHPAPASPALTSPAAASPAVHLPTGLDSDADGGVDGGVDGDTDITALLDALQGPAVPSV